MITFGFTLRNKSELLHDLSLRYNEMDVIHKTRASSGPEEASI